MNKPRRDRNRVTFQLNAETIEMLDKCVAMIPDSNRSRVIRMALREFFVESLIETLKARLPAEELPPVPSNQEFNAGWVKLPKP